MWHHSVSTWRHDVTEPTVHISACRCARKLILFLSPWFFRSLISKMLLISHLCDDVMSWRDVMTSQKPDLPISACRCATELILFLFPCFFRSLSSKMLLIFHLCDDVTSWRHVMTSQNLIYLSQLVDVLESWFFFCVHGCLGHGVKKCHWFFNCVMTWCHDVMSWRHKTRFTYLSW